MAKTKMTKRRDWPYFAGEARDECAIEAFMAMLALKPLAQGKAMTQEQTRLAALDAITHMQEIRAWLISVGAKVRP
jgi:hypothetical protein